MSKTIRELIHDKGDDLTRTDQKITRILLADYPTSALHTVAELAELAQVSDPSILRFVKRLGFDSYPQFQQAAQHEIKDSLEHATDAASGSNLLAPHLPDYATEYLRQLNVDLDKTISRLLSAELQGVSHLLADESKRIVSLSDSANAPNLMAFHRGLFSLRSNCVQLESDPLMRSNAIKDIKKSDVVVVFQYAPYDVSTVTFCRLAAERGASLIVCADDVNTPLAGSARYLLTAPNSSRSMIPSKCMTELMLLATRSAIGPSARSAAAELHDIDFSNLDPEPGG